MNQTNTRSPQRSKAGLPGRFSKDGYFSEPGYLDPSDRSRKEYKGGILNERVQGGQMNTSASKSGLGLGESAYRDNARKKQDRNACFGVFERLYSEAYKPGNFHETEYRKSVEKKVIGPQWRPSDGGKAKPTGTGVGFH